MDTTERLSLSLVCVFPPFKLNKLCQYDPYGELSAFLNLLLESEGLERSCHQTLLDIATVQGLGVEEICLKLLNGPAEVRTHRRCVRVLVPAPRRVALFFSLWGGSGLRAQKR